MTSRTPGRARSAIEWIRAGFPDGVMMTSRSWAITAGGPVSPLACSASAVALSAATSTSAGTPSMTWAASASAVPELMRSKGAISATTGARGDATSTDTPEGAWPIDSEVELVEGEVARTMIAPSPISTATAASRTAPRTLIADPAGWTGRSHGPTARDRIAGHEQRTSGARRQPLQRQADACHGLAQPIDRLGVCDAQMLFGCGVAEVPTGRQRDARRLQEPFDEAETVVGELGDVAVDVEGSLWAGAHREPNLRQLGEQHVAPGTQLRTPSLEHCQPLRGERGKRGVLGRRRCTDVEILRDLLDLARASIRDDQPAEPPTGHLKVLREAVDDPHVVGDRQDGLRSEERRVGKEC